MTLINAEELNFERASPRHSGRGRRIGVIVMGMILAGVACGIIGLALTQGSWWYSYGDDQALDQKSRSRIEAIRDAVDASGAAPQVVVWLNAALNPNTDPSTVRRYLLSAQDALKATDDPQMVEAAQELQTIIGAIRPSPVSETTTPYPVSTPEWP